MIRQKNSNSIHNDQLERLQGVAVRLARFADVDNYSTRQCNATVPKSSDQTRNDQPTDKKNDSPEARPSNHPQTGYGENATIPHHDFRA